MTKRSLKKQTTKKKIQIQNKVKKFKFFIILEKIEKSINIQDPVNKIENDLNNEDPQLQQDLTNNNS